MDMMGIGQGRDKVKTKGHTKMNFEGATLISRLPNILGQPAVPFSNSQMLITNQGLTPFSCRPLPSKKQPKKKTSKES
jgi:hypothetical protein